MKMSLIFMKMTTNFHKKGFTLDLVLKQASRKWPLLLPCGLHIHTLPQRPLAPVPLPLPFPWTVSYVGYKAWLGNTCQLTRWASFSQWCCFWWNCTSWSGLINYLIKVAQYCVRLDFGSVDTRCSISRNITLTIRGESTAQSNLQRGKRYTMSKQGISILF